ncbi:MAG TPA: phosphoglycerate dehydrogenase [Actinomycetota bacterium]|nr:phosphoglycerate dehydrogenase [Actinomycetota bacterium]
MRVLVTEKLSEAGLELLRKDLQVDVRLDLASGDLASEIAPYDALVVRSQTQVTSEVIAAAESLKVVARAGIGLDNVDVEAATRRGVMVVNAPQSNIVSAAEHTIALLLAQARNVPQANAALKDGRWERAVFEGVELQGKTLGIVGLGRVGALVAQRAAAFGMRIIAFDPYVPKERAKEMGIELMPTLEALLVQADFITVHLPRTPDTEGLIGERELALVKEGARLVNTARGGIVDEVALAKALEDGRLGGAALDVFADEPTTDSPLFGFEQVVVTPHLGASTTEAQDKAGTSVAEMVRLALSGEFVPFAVNVSAGAEVSETIKPFLSLANKLGALLTGLAQGAVRGVEAQYLGRIADVDTRVLTLAVVRGVLRGVVHEPVSFVNAPIIASERGIAITETRSTVSSDYVNLVHVRADTDEGPVSVAGTLVGKRNAERVMQVNDYDIEMAPARYMLFFTYEDRPGVIGTVGTVLGEAGINIATMDVGRPSRGGTALMGLTLDSAVPPDVIERIRVEIEAGPARFIVLPD